MQTALNTIAAVMGVESASNGKLSYLNMPWSALRYQHTAAIRARLLEKHRPATVNKLLSALRAVLKEAWKLGQMTAEDYQRAVEIENVKIDTLPAGRDLKQGEIRALVGVCMEDSTPAGVRDAAIIGLLYSTGLRRSEVVKLTLEDFEAGRITVRSGKGRKDRTVYATNGALMALNDWLGIRGDTPGALFTPINKGGKVSIESLTSQAIYNMLEKRAAQAGVENFSPHDFRRTFAGDMLDEGVDIVTVAKLMGHASVETTARYDRRPEDVKRAAASKLHFPYQRKGN
jgi:integrase